MIVNEAITNAKRSAYADALIEGGEFMDIAGAKAIARYPYLTERTVEVLVNNSPCMFKVQAETDHDPEEGVSAGTLLMKTRARTSRWGYANCHVSQLTSHGMRQLADLIDHPLENYVAPAQPAEVAE